MTSSPHIGARTIAATAAALLGIGLLAACSTTNGSGSTAGSAAHSGSASSGSSAASPTAPTSSSPPAAAPVHVGLNPGDGTQVGVGMPIIATFNKKVTSAKAFAAATTVTVNGAPVTGAWYFETSDPASGHVMEAHYRTQAYWPAHAKIHMGLPVAGVSAGTGLAFDDNLTIDFTTGAANIGVVNDSGPQHTLTITTDGQPYGTFPVSLGETKTATLSGIKVIMEKVPTVCMHDTAGTYYECGIKDDQRLTYSGEYLHAAPWNVYNIQHGVDSSNGCTNLLPADAAKLYGFLEIGDVVQYPNANGGKMQLGSGYGDWNVPWVQWQTGGAVPTT